MSFWTEWNSFRGNYVTETKYSDEGGVYHLPSNNAYCLNRTTSRGGGVRAPIKEGMDCKVLSCFCSISSDYEILSLLTDNTLVSVVYHRPDGNIPKVLAFFDTLLGFCSDNKLTVIIRGDFNINMLLNTTPKMISIFYLLRMTLLMITKPTIVSRKTRKPLLISLSQILIRLVWLAEF